MTKPNITPDWADTPLLDLTDDPEHSVNNCALMKAAPELYRALAEGIAYALAVVRNWSAGDLAGSVNALEEWADRESDTLRAAHGES